MVLKNKKFDAGLLIVFAVLAPLVSFYFETNLLISIFLFYGLPAIWLSFRLPQYIKKAAFFSFLGATMFFMVDYVAVLDGAWFVSTIFGFRLLGFLPVEDSIWFFLAVYVVVMFYEYFDDYGLHKTRHTRLKYLAILIGLMIIFFIVSLLFYPDFLIIHYAYLWIGLVFSITPIIVVLSVYRGLRLKFLRTNFYMVCLHLPFELIALRLGQWSFPGDNFIGWISLLGVRFPLEEFLIYISMTGIAFLAYYEFYDDDGR